MSTRCNIILKYKDAKFWLYHHCDGYPEGVGADLKTMMDEYYMSFHKDEGDIEDLYNFVNLLLKSKKDDGYELTEGIHGNIEYLYEVDFETMEIRTFSLRGIAKF